MRQETVQQTMWPQQRLDVTQVRHKVSLRLKGMKTILTTSFFLFFFLRGGCPFLFKLLSRTLLETGKSTQCTVEVASDLFSRLQEGRS